MKNETNAQTAEEKRASEKVLTNISDLPIYSVHDQLSPELETYLHGLFNMLKVLSMESMDKTILQLDRLSRLQLLMKKGSTLQLKGGKWEEIMDKIMDVDYFRKLYPIFHVYSDLEEMKIVLKALIENEMLYVSYCEI